MLLGDLEQLRGALPLLPQRAATTRVHARHEQGTCRTLPESRGEQRRPAHLLGDQLIELIGIEDEELGAGRFGVGIRNPGDDPVVAGDRGSLHPEALADAGVHSERPRRVHMHAVRGVQDHPPVADLVAAALDGEALVGGQGAGGLALLGEVGEQVRGRPLVEPRLGETPGGLGRFGRGDLATEATERLTELGRAPEAVAVPERHLPRLAECGDHVDAVVGDLDDAPARGAEGEHVVHARLVDHLLIEFADPGVAGLARDEHAEQAAIGNGAAAGDGDALCAGAAGDHSEIAIPDHARAQFGEPVGGVATRQQVERRLVGAARERPKRRAASDGLVPALDVDRADRGGGDGLLREDVERVLRDADGLDAAGEHPLGHDGGVQHIAAVLGEQGGAADLADLVAGAPDPLQPGCRRRRRLDLDHEVDRAHVDAQFQAAGRHHAAQAPGLQFVLDLGALLFRH